MNGKKTITAILTLLLSLACISASQAAGTENTTEGESMIKKDIGVFDFESHTVLLNSGYTMPIMGLGTYSLDHDTCVNSVKTLLE